VDNPAKQQGINNSNQKVMISQEDHESIIEAIRQVKEDVQQQGESISDKKREELERVIALAEDGLKAKEPKLEQLKGYSTSIKKITEGTAVEVSVASKIVPILGMLGG
jgi:molecular chaperone DnaK (HSP70)